jgi:putative acetyltransferase
MAIQIRPIEAHEVGQAKEVIAAVCCEIWRPESTPTELLAEWDGTSFTDDLDNVRSHYFEQGGTFLVLVDESRVVGMGGIRRLDDDTCELKRMWFLKEYRGKGLGTKLGLRLFDFAREAGYKKVRLDVFQPDKQQQAVRCYERLGFYRVEPYNDSPCGLFMERVL